MDLISTLVGFVVGTFTGAASGYFAGKFTDQRKEKEKDKAFVKKCDKLKISMPELFAEMEADVCGDDSGLTREFVVLNSEVTNFWDSPKKRFAYYHVKHSNLTEKIEMLERAECITLLKPDSQIYLFDEDFAKYLRRRVRKVRRPSGTNSREPSSLQA
jgi:hypothetical protein